MISLVSLSSVDHLNQITNQSLLIFPRVRQVVQTRCWHQLGWALWRCSRALDTKIVVDMCSLLSPLHMDFVYFCRRPKLWRDTHKLEFKTIILSPSVTELFWETVTTNMHGLEKYTSNIMQCLIYTQMNSIEIYWIFLEILLTCIANLGLYLMCGWGGGWLPQADITI